MNVEKLHAILYLYQLQYHKMKLYKQMYQLASPHVQ